MSYRPQSHHHDAAEARHSLRGSKPSVFQLSKLSLGDIVALAQEGTARLGGANCGASPTQVDSHPHHAHRRRPSAQNTSPSRAVGSTGRPHKDKAARHNDSTSPKQVEHEQLAAPSRQYVLQLESALSSADQRHEDICRVLYDSVVRMQQLELCLQEASHRQALQAQADHDARSIAQDLVRSACAAAAVMSRKFVAAQQDREHIMSTTNSVVSTTAQSYVLNDLRKLLQEQHAASKQAMTTLDTRLATMIETHATTLHMAVSQSKETVAALQRPLEAQLKTLTASLSVMQEALLSARDEVDAARMKWGSGVQDSILQLSLRRDIRAAASS
jgi:hypothetical protein